MRPKIGRSHVIYCVDLYQQRRAIDLPGGPRDVVTAIEGQLRRSSLVPVISDFLFANAGRVVRELSLLNAVACTVTPVLLMMMAIERLGASLTSQFGMVGPVSTILLGVVLLGEPFTAWTATGTLAVLAGVALLARWR